MGKDFANLANSDLLTTEQAAEFLEISPAQLRVWRAWYDNKGPDYITLPDHSVRYPMGGLRAWKYIRLPEVLEYIARKALMMPLFNEFTTPDVCKKLLGDPHDD